MEQNRQISHAESSSQKSPLPLSCRRFLGGYDDNDELVMDELELDDMVINLRILPRFLTDPNVYWGLDRELLLKIGLAALASGGYEVDPTHIVNRRGRLTGTQN